MFNSCPYCFDIAYTIVTNPTRARPDVHKLVTCDSCGDYYIKHINGRSFPLDDRTSEEGDPITRVIDT